MKLAVPKSIGGLDPSAAVRILGRKSVTVFMGIYLGMWLGVAYPAECKKLMESPAGALGFAALSWKLSADNEKKKG